MGNNNSRGLNQNIDKYNSFIEKAQKAIMCDSNCQKQKTADELKQKYLASEANLASADNQVYVAEKNFLTFTEGELSYNNKQQEKLHKKAKLIISKYKDNFNKDIKQIRSKIDTYSGITMNVKNIIELYSSYKEENDELSKKVKDNTSDVLTNERKSYYESQGIDSLKFYYYYILLLVYVILVIIYIFNSFLYKSQLQWKTRFGILFVLLLLPFISSWILAFIINIIYKCYELLPKNIHLHI
jgi:hypothetical protein